MRKYRGLTKEGKFIKGDLVHSMDGRTAIIPPIQIFPDAPWKKIVLQAIVEVIPETIGQSTGLKDKNGKEIYEGDILSYYDFKGKFTVKWGHWGWRLEGTIPDEDRTQWPPITMPSGNFEYIEIVGTIHTTPELLERVE